jgi:hypothetical protein
MRLVSICIKPKSCRDLKSGASEAKEMTTPDERTRALVHTKAFLQELQVSDELPISIREAARALLRHYPSLPQIELAHWSLPAFFGPILPHTQLASKVDVKGVNDANKTEKE